MICAHETAEISACFWYKEDEVAYVSTIHGSLPSPDIFSGYPRTEIAALTPELDRVGMSTWSLVFLIDIDFMVRVLVQQLLFSLDLL